MSLSVGERLRAAREQKKISLEEACRVTKIQRRILEAIEGGRAAEVLSPAYARIFLKRYAAYLGLDGAAVVSEYLGGSAEDSSSSVRIETELTREESRRSWTGVLVPAGGMLAAVVGVAFLAYLSMDLCRTLSRSRPPVAPIPQTQTRAAQPLVPLDQPLTLALRTTDKVWLQIKSDGGVIFQGVLDKGSRESWTAKRQIEIWTGNASAMQMTLNGKPLEGLGRGVRKGVKVTHRGLVPPE